MNLKQFELLILVVLLSIISGCGQVETETSFGLSIDDSYFAEIGPNGELIPISDPAYSSGEKVVYALENIGKFEKGNDGLHWLDLDMEVKDSEGNVIYLQRGMLGEGGHVLLNNDIASSPYGAFELADEQPGTYNIKLTVHDLVGGGSASSSSTFKVIGSESSPSSGSDSPQTLYVCSTGETVSDPNLCPTTTPSQATPQQTTEEYIGNWDCPTDEGNLPLDFSSTQMTFGGDPFSYTPIQGGVRVQGNLGPVDFGIVVEGDILELTLPDEGLPIRCFKSGLSGNSQTSPIGDSPSTSGQQIFASNLIGGYACSLEYQGQYSDLFPVIVESQDLLSINGQYMNYLIEGDTFYVQTQQGTDSYKIVLTDEYLGFAYRDGSLIICIPADLNTLQAIISQGGGQYEGYSEENYGGYYSDYSAGGYDYYSGGGGYDAGGYEYDQFAEDSAGWPGGAYMNPDSGYYDYSTYE
jgi:hypothetical protein